MLPYSDRTVVLSRYALGWVSLLIGTAAVTLCQGIVSCLPVRIEAAAGLSPALIYTALCVGTILLSINVPLTLRFGSEKGPGWSPSSSHSLSLLPWVFSRVWTPEVLPGRQLSRHCCFRRR